MSLPATQSHYFNVMSLTFEEQLKWAAMVCKTEFVPAAYRGKPESLVIAVQYGAEVGLKPLQAIQGIAVINGKPSLFGDALLAVCRNNPEWQDFKEIFDKETMRATCIVTRRGQSPIEVSFDKEGAIQAKLWGKSGPWTTYPERMLQMRARGFALRNAYADSLCGFISSDEALDYPMLNDYQYHGTPQDIQPVTTPKESIVSNLELLINYLSEKCIPQETIDKALVYYSEKSGNSKESITTLTEFESSHMLEQLKKREEK